MIKKQNNVVLLLLLVTFTIATIYFLSFFQQQDITGMSPTRVGIATIRFGNETPPPPPPPSSGGGSSAGQAQCCNYTRYEGQEYECRCFIYDHEVVRMQPTICCDEPTDPKCLPFCSPVQQPTPPPAQGVCPIEQTCGQKCCKQGELCRNGKCFKELPAPPIQMQLPPPPEIEAPYLVAVPYTEYAFPWWYFVLAILILLTLTYLLLRQPKREAPKPAPTPAKRAVKRPVKRRKKRK